MADRGSSADLSVWVSRVQWASNAAPRSLYLLRDIQKALDAVRRERELFEMLSRAIREEGARLFSTEMAKPIDDAKGSLQRSLLRAQKRLKQQCEKIRGSWESAKADAHLTSDDELVEEFGRCVSSAVELHNNINSLRWRVAEHDADYAKVTGHFATVDDLTEYLNSKRCA